MEKRNGVIIIGILVIQMVIFQDGFNKINLEEEQEFIRLEKLQNSKANLIKDRSFSERNCKIEGNLKGFTKGFLKNNGQKNDSIYYYTASSYMIVEFGESKIIFNIINLGYKHS